MMGLLKKMSVKISAVLLSLGLIALQAAPVMAADGGYTYTVRLYSGAQGTIKGEELVVHKGLHYGERVTFNQRDVVLNDNSKYYIKGIRESGKDNNTVNSTSSFPVTADMDYVVVYGLLGDSVAYTVNYLDADGNELAPSETYYGNVGDTPVLAYLYIDGYQPQAYNLTGTLNKDASKNVFNFVYSPVSSGVQQSTPAAPTVAPPVAPGTQPTTAPAANNPPAATTGTTGGENAETDDDDEGEAGEDEEGGGETGGDEAGQAAAEEGNEPEELQQIGDEEVPLADMGDGTSGLQGLSDDFAERVGELPLAAKIGICSAVLLALGAAGWFLLGRRGKKAEIE